MKELLAAGADMQASPTAGIQMGFPKSRGPFQEGSYTEDYRPWELRRATVLCAQDSVDLFSYLCVGCIAGITGSEDVRRYCTYAKQGKIC